MRKSSFPILASIILFSCSPILRQDSIRKINEMDYEFPVLLVEMKPAEPSAEVTMGEQKILEDQTEKTDRDQLLAKPEVHDVHLKGSPVTADDMLIEKPEVQELPISGEQAAVEEKALELPKAEKGVDGQKPVVQGKKSFSGMYYVQIGAWKNPDFAEKMFNKVRGKYHETHIIVENNLHKVRILGVRTKEEGMYISQDIEKTFNIRPIVVRNPQ